MKNFRNVLALLVALVFQIGLGKILATWQVIPNFILIIVLAWCLLYDYSEALLWAFVGGVFLEAYENPALFGTNIISIILVISIANAVLHYILKQINYWIVFLTGFLGTVLYDVLRFALKEHSHIVEAGIFGEYFSYNFKLFLWEGVLNSILLVAMIYILQKTKKISRRLKQFE